MLATDYRVLRKMDVRYSIFKLLLFLMLVGRCTAKYIHMPSVHAEHLQDEIQDSIRQTIHTGIYSHKHLDTSQVQVTVPVKVTREGALVSHTVEHAHAHGHAQAHAHGQQYGLGVPAPAFLSNPSLFNIKSEPSAAGSYEGYAHAAAPYHSQQHYLHALQYGLGNGEEEEGSGFLHQRNVTAHAKLMAST